MCIIVKDLIINKSCYNCEKKNELFYRCFLKIWKQSKYWLFSLYVEKKKKKVVTSGINTNSCSQQSIAVLGFPF